MALTSGERAALWRKRQKNDPEKHKVYLEKEKERYKRRKEKGMLKSIENMSTREKRKTRRNWRKNQKAKRARDQMILNHVEQTLSPPTSPNNEIDDRNDNNSMKKNGRKKVGRDRAKCYREIFKLRVDLDNQRRLKERYRKQAYRFRKSANQKEIDKDIESKMKSEELRKSLTLHIIMIRNIKRQYTEMKSQRDKRVIRQLIFKNSILMKYRLGKYAMKVTGISTKAPKKERQKYRRTPWIKLLVRNFIERDDNSRMKGGKKSTKTMLGEKKQIRFLNDTLKNIHAKFLSENNTMISYSLFCKLKPFWIVKPNEKVRETCLCKIHENVQYKLNRLFQEKVIDNNNLDEQIKQIVCDANSKSCMYRECLACQNKELPKRNADGRQVWWYTWKNTRVDKMRPNDNGEMESREVLMTVKDKDYGTIETLYNELIKDLPRACRHVFNIKHQYSTLKTLRETLDSDSVIIHMDFSENYGCKYEREIQSMHFGASQKHISLHTSVAYLKANHERKISFCTISDCLKHTPPSIWAHLLPVMRYIKGQSNVTTVHFVSDGPTTQYRSKTNFYLLSKTIYEFGFKHATWNFLEASHGKGAPDGIGAVIKRNADHLVNVNQKDIMSSHDLIDGLKSMGTNVMLFEVKGEDITAYEEEVEDIVLKTVPDTMKIHQEPDLVTNRHRQIDPVIWRAIVDELQLDGQGRHVS